MFYLITALVKVSAECININYGDYIVLYDRLIIIYIT